MINECSLEFLNNSLTLLRQLLTPSYQRFTVLADVAENSRTQASSLLSLSLSHAILYDTIFYLRQHFVLISIEIELKRNKKIRRSSTSHANGEFLKLSFSFKKQPRRLLSTRLQYKITLTDNMTVANEVTADVSDIEHVFEGCYEPDSRLLSQVFEFSMSERVMMRNSSYKHLETHCKILQHQHHLIIRIRLSLKIFT